MKKITTIFKSLYSNQACIDARKFPVWVSMIVLALSIFLPWIPSLSGGYTTNTSSFLTASKNCDIDKGFKATLASDYFKKITVTKDSNDKYILSYNFEESDYSTSTADFDNEYIGTNSKALYKGSFTDFTSNDLTPYATVTSYTAVGKRSGLTESFTYYYDHIAVSNTETVKIETSSTSSSSTIEYEDNGRTTYLQNFYIPELSMDTTNYNTYLNNFVSSVILNVSGQGACQRYPHSYAIWAKDFIFVAIYPLKSTKSSISVSGSYTGKVNAGFYNQTVASGTSFYSFLSNNETLTINELYNNNFATYLHEAGRPFYIRSTWINVGILSAVVAGSIIVAGLIILFMNKRKTSIYQEANVWHAFNTAIYLSLTPALIGMIIGFMSSTYQIMAIVGSLLIRIVFISKRIMPPVEPTSSNKPLYQARS